MNVPEYKTLILKKEEGFATVTMNRPDKLNAVNQDLTRELGDVFLELARDKEVRAVILTGTGRAFCSGADLSSPDFQIDNAPEALSLGNLATRLIMSIHELPKPVIGAINGFAVGGGCNLALACDIIIASDKAKFIEPYIQRAVHPDFGAIYFLPRMIGLARACDLIFSGRTVDALEAERIGLVSRVVPADHLQKVTQDLARNLARCSPLVLSMAKTSLNQSLKMDLPTTLNYEAAVQSIIFLTEDFKETMSAFVEKREPKFKGK
jgi:enoyl-CoA hydratase/carnithine racemase